MARGTDTAFRPAVRRGPGPGRPRPAHFGRQWLLALSGIPRHGLRTTRRAARATGQRQGGRRAGHASGAPPHRRDEARLRDAHPRAPRPPAPALSVGAVIGRLQQRFPEAFPRKPAPKLPLKVASATVGGHGSPRHDAAGRFEGYRQAGRKRENEARQARTGMRNVAQT